MTLDEFLDGEFASFFGVEETGHADVPTGTRHDFKTGGFQEHVDLSVTVGSNGRITSVRLALARAWVGNRENVSPFAKDLAKSFVATFMAPEDEPATNVLALNLWQLQGTKNAVDYFGDPPPPPPQAPPGFIEAYVGERTEFRLEGVKSSIALRNDGGKLVLEVTAG